MSVDQAVDTLRRAIVVLSRAREWIPSDGPTDTEIVEVREKLRAWAEDLDKRKGRR